MSESEVTIPSDIDDDDPPISHAITYGRQEFSERVLPAIRGTERAEAHVAFYFGAMYVLQLVPQVNADRSSDALPVALAMLTAELTNF